MDSADTLYGVVKKGVLTLSGGNPSIRVDGGRLMIRDGHGDRTTTVQFTRAEATSGALRHIIVTGDAGGFITFPALEWLNDTGVAISQLTFDGQVVYASGPRGPDRPAIRRTQALAATSETGLAITREILGCKLRGQAQVAGLLGANDAGGLIDRLADEVSHSRNGVAMLASEATAAAAYWKLWAPLPVRFARRDRVPSHWQTFGLRHSPLSSSPQRAATPGNALLNYLYAILQSQMTTALLGVGLDPGVGIFHADKEGRASLASDAIEAVRPYVDYWLAVWLGSAHFAKNDFVELPDGEIRIGMVFPYSDIGLGRPDGMPDYPMKTRITNPLTSHLATTASLWQRAAETVARWLMDSFTHAAVFAGPDIKALPSAPRPALTEAREANAGKASAAEGTIRQLPRGRSTALPPPLPRLPTPDHVWRRGAMHAVIPQTCLDCGKALPTYRRKFCSDTCAISWHGGALRLQSMAALHRARLNHTPEVALRRSSAAKVSRAAEAAWRQRPGWSKARDAALRAWYAATLRPALLECRPADIRRAMDCSPQAASDVRAGRLMPHPRHFEALAELAGVDPSATLPPFSV